MGVLPGSVNAEAQRRIAACLHLGSRTDVNAWPWGGAIAVLRGTEFQRMCTGSLAVVLVVSVGTQPPLASRPLSRGCCSSGASLTLSLRMCAPAPAPRGVGARVRERDSVAGNRFTRPPPSGPARLSTSPSPTLRGVLRAGRVWKSGTAGLSQRRHHSLECHAAASHLFSRVPAPPGQHTNTLGARRAHACPLQRSSPRLLLWSYGADSWAGVQLPSRLDPGAGPPGASGRWPIIRPPHPPWQ